MLSDFAEIWFTKVFECAEYLCFLGRSPQKSDRKLKLSDFDEIWYPGVFEGADLKNRIHFYVE